MSISGSSGVNAFAGLTSVSSITPVGRSKRDDTLASVAGAHRPKRDTFQSDLSSLVQAVRGGDISAAQSALSALQSDVAATDATYSPASTAPTSPAPAASPAQSDLDALFKAVQSGDLAGAQAALGQLQSDVRGSGPHADHASLQGQIHGRGHGRGHGHQGSTLRAAVVAAFQSQTAAPAETPAPAADPVVVDPGTSSVPTPAPATAAA
jgi:hypothetical protein